MVRNILSSCVLILFICYTVTYFELIVTKEEKRITLVSNDILHLNYLVEHAMLMECLNKKGD